MQKTICAMCGEGAVTDRMCQRWFVKFRARDSSLDSAPHSGRPAAVGSDQLETLRTINVMPHRKQLTYSQYSNQYSYWWKWKMCLLFILQKKTRTLWPTRSSHWLTCTGSHSHSSSVRKAEQSTWNDGPSTGGRLCSACRKTRPKACLDTHLCSEAILRL